MKSALAAAVVFLLIMSQCAKAETSHVRYLLTVAVALSGEL